MKLDELEATAEYQPPGTIPAAKPVPTASVGVEIAGLTHRGRVRRDNQDHYLVVNAGRFLRTMATSLPAGTVPDEYLETLYGMGVADGIGGLAGGEVASRTALARLVQLVIETPDWIVPRDEVDREAVLRRMTQRFADVSATVEEEATRDPSLSGMGTTLTMAWSLGLDLHVAHVGDSRAYLSRGGALETLTRDHSVAQRMIDCGLASPDDTIVRRLRHVLTHFLGGSDSRSVPEIQRFGLIDGDRLLLCSDGLTASVDDAGIAAVLGGDAPPAAMAESLLNLALTGGAPDNVTVVVARYRVS